MKRIVTGRVPSRLAAASAVALIAILVAGCGTTGGHGAPPRASASPTVQVPEATAAPVETPAVPSPVEPPVAPPLEHELGPLPATPAPALPQERHLSLTRLLPAGVADREGWATDIGLSLAALRVPATAENVCAAVAVIEQESSFHADPAVPGLPRIARQEIERRRARLGIPRVLLDAAFAQRSRDGRTYRARIDALRTEREMSDIFEELIAELPYGRRLFERYNPVRTGGPMQVSVDFAAAQVRASAYPFPPLRSVRDAVFSRRGGVYFGIAHLLAYPAPYDDALYRFADFNAGRYSARNAAFQSALVKLSRRRVSLDGDLLAYRSDGTPDAGRSDTERALEGVAGRLKMSRGEIRRDLALEKSAAFQDSALYRRVFTLADQSAGAALPRAMLPKIDLHSPKISRHLTTAWFAKRVDERYLRCLAGAEQPAPMAAVVR